MKSTPGLEIRSTEERQPCIWMQAGVVRRKFCTEDYHCVACRFDRIMGRVAEENKRLTQAGTVHEGKRYQIISWKDKLKERPPWRRPCIHHMKRRIEYRACTNEYRCGDCEFDQYFDDQYSVYAVVKPVDLLHVKGFRLPQGYYFHPGHTWVRIEEGATVRVGMDGFALQLLGPLDRVESPLIGKVVQQGCPDISVHRGTHSAKVLAPVSGVVTSINTQLREDGSLANHAPFSDGWIMRVHASNLRESLNNLMIHTETTDFMEGEVDRLYEVIEAVEGPLSTDGGLLSKDIYGSMPHLSWERLVSLFLRT